MSAHPITRIHVLAAVAVAALTLSACTSSASSAPVSTSSEVPATDTAVTAEPAADDDVELPAVERQAAAAAETGAGSEASQPPVTAVPIDDVSDDGVLAAAVIIVSDGDLEAAIAEGLVTEAEAEAALVALETGTLYRYVQG